ncbi:MAG: hypothetical protein PHX50_15090 [Massilibacteroides sp.]|nr:hypothetical protein [Massilibacteroides sp.]
MAHFALQNTKFGSEKGKVRNPARIPPQTPPAGGKSAEAGQIHIPRKIVCPAESKLVFRILLKKCSNFVQKTPPNCTFSEIERCCLGASRLGMIFFRYFEGIFEIARQRAVGNAEVRTNLFSFAFSERLSVFFFDCPKANFKTIWTT